MALASRARRTGGLWRTVKRYRWHYLFLLPMVVLFTAFTVWPMVASAVYSLFHWDGFGPLTDFVGLGNYAEAIHDPAFWRAFADTFAFTGAALLVQVPMALVLATVLNNPRLLGRNAYRALFFLPVVTNTAVVGVIFVVLLSPVGGTINTVLREMGLISQPIAFLGSPGLALPTVIVLHLWKDFGVTLVYWLAALQTIPTELREAALVDGAARRQTFWYVVVPLLAPLGVIILLLTTERSFHAFDLVQTTTGGGPAGASSIIQTYVYQLAFEPKVTTIPRYGFASAAALIFGLAISVFATAQALLVRRIRSRS